MKRNSLMIFILLSLSACNIKLDGRPGNSGTINESKKRGVFISKTKLVGATGGEFAVEESWLEYGWRFTKYEISGTNVDTTRIQFCMNLDPSFRNDFAANWSIALDSRMDYCGLIGDTYVISFKDFYPADSIVFKVVGSDRRDPHGQFELAFVRTDQ